VRRARVLHEYDSLSDAFAVGADDAAGNDGSGLCGCDGTEQQRGTQ
jgi:hypothetical protein